MIFFILMAVLAFWQVWTGVQMMQGKKSVPEAVRRTFATDEQFRKWCKKQGVSRVCFGAAITATLVFPFSEAVGLALCLVFLVAAVVVLAMPVK